ncbi:MarR family winged helix-turn-helix transcriptional regulator [Enterococcus olivae]
MSHFTMQLLKQFETVSTVAHSLFLQNKQRFDGQQQVINILGNEDGLSQGSLAELLDIRPSSLAELLKKLEKAEAVKRVEDDYDKRIKRVYLTEKGRERIIESQPLRENLSTRFFAGLTEEEQIKLGNYLNKLMAGWPEEIVEYQAKAIDPMERLTEMQDLRKAMNDLDWQALSDLDEHRIRHDFQQRFQHFDMEDPLWKRQFDEMMREKRQAKYQETERLKRFKFDSPREHPLKDSDQEWTDF